jgi:MFS family permease
MTQHQQQMTGSGFSKKQVYMALAAVFMSYLAYGYFMQTLNVAAPRMAADLNGMQLYSWSVSIPSLGLAIGTILAGKLSDIYGRRAIILASTVIFLIGAILSAFSPTFMTLIAARTVLCFGQGALAPLCFAVVADMFVAGERAKWIGLLNVPYAIAALCGPTLSGWMVDTLGWRNIFWWSMPLFAICLFVAYGMPALLQGAAHKIDWLGIILITVASATLVFGLSFAGTTYPWGSQEVIGLLAISAVSWAFFLRVESKADEPILDIELIRNRVFMTAAVSGFLSFFGMMGLQLYYPLFMQGIQGISAVKSGLVITPLGLVMSIVGIPVGFLLARTKSYKWMFITGYALVSLVMVGMMFFDKNTPIAFGFLATAISGLALGAMPTVNTIVSQAAVPRRLLGVTTSAIIFSVSMGMSIAPAILGSAMNIRYNSVLKASLPAEISQAADDSTRASLGDPKVLLNKEAMSELRDTLAKAGGNNGDLFNQTIEAIRSSMESGLRTVFNIAAITMIAAFLLILTIPVIPLDRRE